MFCYINNIIKEDLIPYINYEFTLIQKKYKIPKKYWISPIIDIKLNTLNFYSTINNHTLVHINKEYASYYYQFKYKKPLIYIIVFVETNSDSTINVYIIANSNTDLIINKYKGITSLIKKQLQRKLYPHQQEFLFFYNKYKDLIELQTSLSINKTEKVHVNEETYILDTSLINMDYNQSYYNQSLSIDIIVHSSKIYEYSFIEIFINDRIYKKTLYMCRVFYNNSNLKELVYETISGGLKKLKLINKSKINIGEVVLKLSALLKILKTNGKGNLKLIETMAYQEL